MYLKELLKSQPGKVSAIRRFIKMLPIVFLAACSNQANHLGNPLLIPWQYAQNEAQNASYNQRRNSVSAFVTANHDDLIKEIRKGAGPALAVALSLAEVPKDDHPALMSQLRKDIKLYDSDPEALTVALMVYGK